MMDDAQTHVVSPTGVDCWLLMNDLTDLLQRVALALLWLVWDVRDNSLWLVWLPVARCGSLCGHQNAQKGDNTQIVDVLGRGVLLDINTTNVLSWCLVPRDTLHYQQTSHHPIRRFRHKLELLYSPSPHIINTNNMPFVHVTWLPKACRNEKVRKEVASAIIKAITNNEVAKAADIPTDKLVVRFSEA